MRSPWVRPVAAAVLVLLVGAAGVRAVRSATTAEAVLAQQLASVQVGTTQFMQDPGELQEDEQGRLLVPLQAAVRNDGQAPVSLEVEGASTEHAVLAAAPELRELGVGAEGLLEWTLAVDCAEVPSAEEAAAALNQAVRTSSTARTQWLGLRVQVRQEQVQQRFFTADAPGSDIAFLLPFACNPFAVAGQGPAGSAAQG